MSNKRPLPRCVSDAELLLYLSRNAASFASPAKETEKRDESSAVAAAGPTATPSSSSNSEHSTNFLDGFTALQRLRDVAATAFDEPGIVSSSESDSSDSDDFHDDEDIAEHNAIIAERERACEIFDAVFDGEDFDKFTSLSLPSFSSTSNKKARTE